MAKLRIYTDGACSGNPGPGGWSVVISKDEDNDSYGGHELETTNNRMELKAVTEAITIAMEKYSKYDTVEISSDSAYVLNAINSNWVSKWKLNGWKTASNGEVKNKDMWVKISEVIARFEKSGRSISFIKVKGHSGNIMNEIADVKARSESIIAKKKKEAASL